MIIKQKMRGGLTPYFWLLIGSICGGLTTLGFGVVSIFLDLDPVPKVFAFLIAVLFTIPFFAGFDHAFKAENLTDQIYRYLNSGSNPVILHLMKYRMFRFPDTYDVHLNPGEFFVSENTVEIGKTVEEIDDEIPEITIEWGVPKTEPVNIDDLYFGT